MVGAEAEGPLLIPPIEKEGMIETPLLTDSPLVLPRSVEHNATTIPIIGEDTTQPSKDTKEGWQERQQ